MKRAAAGAAKPKSYRDLVFAALPGATIDIISSTGFSLRTVQTWVRRLRDAGEVRIINWRRPETFGAFVPIYGPGNGPDAVCTLIPFYGTNESAWKRRKAVMKPEQRERMRIKARTKKQVKSAAKRGDPLVLALFGKTTSSNAER